MSSGVNGTLRVLAQAGLLAAGLLLAGCQTDGAPLAESGSTGSAVAFDVIDGTPRPTFDALVASLTTAAEAHKVDAVSRTEDPPYRVKGTFSLKKAGKATAVAYVWDVYGRDGARVAQVTGQESLGTVKKGTDPWSVCDAAVLDKIADHTMAELSETLAPGAPSAVAAATAPAGGQDAPATAPATTPAAPATAVRAAGLGAPSGASGGASLAYAGR